MRYSRKKSGLKKSVTVNERIGLSWSSRLMAQTINPQQNHKSSFATTLDILFEQAKLICFNILWPKKTILSESEAKLRSIYKTDFLLFPTWPGINILIHFEKTESVWKIKQTMPFRSSKTSVSFSHPKSLRSGSKFQHSHFGASLLDRF